MEEEQVEKAQTVLTEFNKGNDDWEFALVMKDGDPTLIFLNGEVGWEQLSDLFSKLGDVGISPYYLRRGDDGYMEIELQEAEEETDEAEESPLDGDEKADESGEKSE